MARDNHNKIPAVYVLVYPIAQSNVKTYSYKKNAIVKLLNYAMMGWFYKTYLSSAASASGPRIDVTLANLGGLLPTIIITDELFPYQSDGEMLRDKMKEQGIEVTYNNYDGVTHEFFGMAAVVPEANQAQTFASGQLKNLLSNNNTKPINGSFFSLV